MNSPRRPTALIVAVLHLLVGSIGVAAITAIAWYATQEVLSLFIPKFDHRLAVYLLLEVPGFPLQMIQGIYLGFVLSRRFGGRASQFTWILPLCLSAVAWLLSPSRSSFFEHYSSKGDCGFGDDCFERAVATQLLVGAAAYSLGAAAGLRKRSIGRATKTVHDRNSNGARPEAEERLSV